VYVCGKSEESNSIYISFCLDCLYISSPLIFGSFTFYLNFVVIITIRVLGSL
jgi:hypothetical protein